MRASVLIIAASISAVASVSTRAAADAADEAYAEASELFERGAYDEALERVDAGLEESPESLRLLRLRGDVLLEVRDFEGALAAYKAFLEAGPEGADRRSARRIVEDLRSVRSTFLEIVVENGPAKIYLDSRAFGVYCVADPSCEKGVLPGRYRVYIEREGYESLVERVQVPLGETTVIERTLSEENSELAIDVVPQEAEVVIDGETIGRGSQRVSVPAGEHEVTVRAEGFAESTRSIAAETGEPVELEVALSELVELEIDPPGATILLDGEPARLEGGAIAVPHGRERTLTVRAEGHEEKSVTIDPGGERKEPLVVELDRIVEPGSEPAPEPGTPEPTGEGLSRGRAVAAVGLGGLGLASFTLAASFGAQARGDWDASKAHCDGDVRCSSEGFTRVKSAQRTARRADVALAAGGAASAAALALWLVPEPDEIGRKRAIAATGLGALGAAGLALATGFGLEATDRWGQSRAHCDLQNRCDALGIELIEDAQAAAARANVSLAVGGIASATALGLWLFPSGEGGPSLSAGPSADGSGGGVSLRAQF